VRGEDWTAEAGDGPIEEGEEVRVVAIEGITLRVVKG
jgi:membrane protein implicated in regulation of membrane protease activity